MIDKLKILSLAAICFLLMLAQPIIYGQIFEHYSQHLSQIGSALMALVNIVLLDLAVVIFFTILFDVQGD